MFEAIIGHGNGIGVEGVRLDDIGASLEILPMDGFNDVWLRQVERVVIEAEIFLMIGKFLAAVIGFNQAMRLNHGAHGSIEQQDAIPHLFGYFVANVLALAHRLWLARKFP